MSYPNSDSTSSDVQKVIFNPGIVSFNEDFQAIEDNRELEDITRFNSIVKKNGIVSDKRTNDTTVLFPSVVSGNQISISKGTGFTRNGARIYIPLALSILDVTALPNYVTPSSTKDVYIVLRKISQDYQSRSHPITGVSTYTRKRLKSDNTIVECFVDDTTVRDDELNTDRDIVVICRLASVSPVTFDTTETTGGRTILRTTESKAVEVVGATMEGDLNMNNLYNVMNTPQWSKTKYNIDGNTHNRDFIRLFSRINYTLSVLRGIKFTQSTGNWGIQFEAGNSVKMSLIPNQRPPKQINVTSAGTFVTIPENNVLYLQLSDTDILLASTGVVGNVELDSGISSNFFVIKNFLTSTNIGNSSDSSLLRFPLCYHFVDSVTGIRKLVFANGLTINAEELIDSDGKYSGYVRRDGGNIMIGDLNIEKNNARLYLRRGINPSQNTKSGIFWTNENGQIATGNLSRVDYVVESDSQSDDVVGDVNLEVFNNAGNVSNKFKFKADGKLVIPTAPVTNNEGVRLKELNDAITIVNTELDTKYDKTGGEISGNVEVTGTLGVDGISRFSNDVEFKEDTNPSVEAFYSKLIVNRTTAIEPNLNSLVYLRQYDPSGLPNDLSLTNNSHSAYLSATTGNIAPISSTPYVILTLNVPSSILSRMSTIMINCVINLDWAETGGSQLLVGGLRSPNGNIIQYFYLDIPTGQSDAITTTISFSKIIRKRELGLNTIAGNYTLEILDAQGSSPVLTIRGGNLVEGGGTQTHMEYVVLT